MVTHSEPTEAQEQVAVVEWCDWRHIPVMHIPNEGKRSRWAGYQLKRQGLRPGVPDLFVPVARGGYHGLFVEMKRRDGGRLTEAQREWIDLLGREGYRAVVCHGADEAIREIGAYVA